MEYLNDIIFSEASIYLGIIAIVMSVISLLTIIEQWILFNKLGEKGWKSLIPIYNNWVYLKLGDLPGWLILLPIANAIGLIVASFNIPKKLNKSTALGILYLISPNIYYLVLILGKTPSKSETNNIIEIELLTLNSSDNDVYIKLDLNAGYEWNDIVLDNQFELLTSDKYTPDIDMNILAYVDGIEKDAYPNSCNYITKLKGYNGNTEVDITGSYAVCDRETNTWQILVKGLVKKVVVNFIYQPGSPAFKYTGKFKIENGDTTDWKIYLLTSGTLTFTDETPNIDVFLVGGGGAGASGVWASGYVQVKRRSGGAGSGYTLTKKDISLDINTSYKIIIGEGGTSNAENTYTDGTATSAFSFTAKGGKGTKRDGEHYKGGDGGSGGGNEGYEGATDGSGGTNSGTGQGTTTREFGESQGKLYATGGSGISKKDGQPNTGDGGSGGRYADSSGGKIGSGGNGGSGIVVIRSHKIS